MIQTCTKCAKLFHNLTEVKSPEGKIYLRVSDNRTRCFKCSPKQKRVHRKQVIKTCKKCGHVFELERGKRLRKDKEGTEYYWPMNRKNCYACMPDQKRKNPVMKGVQHRKCYICKRLKVVTEFYVRSDRTTPAAGCKKCHSDRSKDRAVLFMLRARNQKGCRCECCASKDLLSFYQPSHVPKGERINKIKTRSWANPKTQASLNEA